jgi:hypothetical protein
MCTPFARQCRGLDHNRCLPHHSMPHTPPHGNAGISVNKMLSKLVSGVHKPDDQTILPPGEAWVRGRPGAPLPPPLKARPPPPRIARATPAAPAETAPTLTCEAQTASAFNPPANKRRPPQAFLEPLPVRALPGIGLRLAAQLGELGATTVAELRRLPAALLTSRLGEANGARFGEGLVLCLRFVPGMWLGKA